MTAARFRRALLAWYDAGHRDLPWRDPNGTPATVFYHVWLSEIMLQQTRVEAVIPYYQRFLERFPSIEALAAAEEQEVLAAWSGLGYYSRARNLQHAARQLAADGLPCGYEAIRALRGIGDYTAAALASIAMNMPHAAVDGNVMRVIARLTNNPSEITAPATRRRIAETASLLLDRDRPGDFNQAMMELGATVCTPRAPRCDACPVTKLCAARRAGTQQELPVKLSKKTVRELKVDLAIVERDGHIVLVKRASGERRLAGFWELPARDLIPGDLTQGRARSIAKFRHQIVNDRFIVTVWRVSATSAATLPAAGEWVLIQNLKLLPLTTVSRKALEAASFVTGRVKSAKTL
jgi:A/G-specific adenine glycosylase